MTPEEFQQRVQSMLGALQAGRSADAGAQAESLLRDVPGEPNASQVLAMLHLQKGEADKAVPHLRAAERAAPNYPPILNMLGVAYKQYGRWDEARGLFRRARTADPNFIDAVLNLAQLDLDDARLADAKQGFDAALKLQPENATALAGRARVALLQHDADAAAEFAERALGHQPGHMLARLTLTVARLRQKDFAAARENALKVTEQEGVSPTNRAYAFGFAGEAADRLEEYDRAFGDYTKANNILADLHRSIMDAPATAYSLETIRKLKDAIDDLGPPPPCADDEPMPVFLVGFPRSGTTLLEQVLVAHPMIESYGEQVTLASACEEVILGEDAIDRLKNLDETAARACRNRYWQEVEALGSLPPPGGLYLDKLPLNTVLLPVIAKVFPRAKILFALRDPRDVVLSCFQQRFGINQAMYQFLALETAAAFYDQVMSLGDVARRALSLDMREVRYEDVVHDLENEARQTIAFLGLEWDRSVLSYRDGARARVIDTPSVAQVVEPIYNRARGKWRNYEAHLVSVLPTLDRWAETFGYE